MLKQSCGSFCPALIKLIKELITRENSHSIPLLLIRSSTSRVTVQVSNLLPRSQSYSQPSLPQFSKQEELILSTTYLLPVLSLLQLEFTLVLLKLLVQPLELFIGNSLLPLGVENVVNLPVHAQLVISIQVTSYSSRLPIPTSLLTLTTTVRTITSMPLLRSQWIMSWICQPT